MQAISKQRLFRLLTLLLLLLNASCSTEDFTQLYSGSDSTGEGSEESTIEEEATRSMPWEVWAPGRDVRGGPILNFGLLGADERAKKGERMEALEDYLRIDKTTLTANEREALSLRIASMQLALGQGKQSLDTISAFFTSRNLGPDAVAPEFALVLAHAYARTENIPQSLAWFSRAYNTSSVNSSFAQAATTGAKSYLRTLPNDQFEMLATTWASDPFVHGLIGQERQIRATMGIQGGANVGDLNINTQSPTTLTAGAPITLGMLLPLSGKFGTLGRNAANGIELALGDAAVELGRPGGVTFATRDDVGDPAVAGSHARELFTSARPLVTFGPLLSDPATVVADVARETNASIITFSKKNVFNFAPGVFRLGATPDSQVDSLLGVSRSTLGVNRFALVYPNDGNGTEFATAFRAKAAEIGAEILFDRVYTKDDYQQLLLIAQEVEGYKVQAIFFPDNLLAASRFAQSLSANFRQNTRFLGTASWDDPIQLARFQIALDNSVFVSPFFVQSQRPIIKKFIESYKSRYQQAPDFLAAQGFDAATLALAALKRTVQMGTPFAQALLEVGQYDGLTGRLLVTARGEIQRNFNLVEFKNGMLSEIVPGERSSSFTYRGDLQTEKPGDFVGNRPNLAPIGGGVQPH